MCLHIVGFRPVGSASYTLHKLYHCPLLMVSQKNITVQGADYFFVKASIKAGLRKLETNWLNVFQPANVLGTAVMESCFAIVEC